jgi:Dolichyl-phosphate-mannose-protein mannosyltransferase
MDASTVTRPASGGTLRARPAGPASPSPRRRVLAHPLEYDLTHVALGALLLTTFVLRLWGIKQGLPYSYNVDEATHFVPRAIAFFSHDLNPHYFLNPPAYSYLLHGVFEFWFGSSDAVTRSYADDPTAIYVVARVVAALLGTLAVWLTYLAGARLVRRDVGLLAAAIFGLAFLPIFYSHLALNDVPTLAPVALSLYGIAGVLRLGRQRDYLLAGLGIGLAAATKYTGGITLICLLAAFVFDASGGRIATASRRLGAALLLALLAFLLANPYAVLDFHTFTSGVSSQASLAAGADPVKLGTSATSGVAYYLWTFTWGLGWGPTLAAISGAILLVARRQIALALVLLPAPIVFIIFMGNQQRFFGRWLMPIFPLVAIVGAYGALAAVRWLASTRRLPAPAGLVLAAVLLLSQSLVSVIHNDQVLSRPDTRNATRAWMRGNVPAGAKVVIEPVVSDNWATDVGSSLPWTLTGDRWYRYPTWLTDVDSRGRPLPPGKRRYVVVDQYERTLRPRLLDEYVSGGYCWLAIGSLQAGRAFAQPGDAPAAVAYYTSLRKRARLRYHVSPFTGDARAVPFSFDWSIDYLPRQYRLPGPDMSVYQLRGGKCG